MRCQNNKRSSYLEKNFFLESLVFITIGYVGEMMVFNVIT